MSTPRLQIHGDQFVLPDGEVWLWRGVTDFALLRVLIDEPAWLPTLIQPRLDAGANLFRVLAMKADNTGWALNPVAEGWNGQFHNPYSDAIRALARALEQRDAYLELTVFADTKAIMPDPNQQQHFWQDILGVVAGHPNVLLELINEAGHSTQQCHPLTFPRPVSNLASRGSGGTDEPPVTPTWDFATYHGRRNAPPDSRGIIAYDPYAFESEQNGLRPGWPKECPYICDEGMKPENYGCDVGVAYAMGQHAACGAGGTFHQSEGVNSLPWPSTVEACARSFFEAME